MPVIRHDAEHRPISDIGRKFRFLMTMRKILIVTTISGFVQQFEMNDVKLMQEYGFEVHYASNFTHPVYACDRKVLEQAGIHTHHIPIEKSPYGVENNIRALMALRDLIGREGITHIHCHNPMGGVTARLAARLSDRFVYVIYTAHGFHFYKGASPKNWILYGTAEKLLSRYTNEIVTINKEDYLQAKEFPSSCYVSQIHSVGVNDKRFYPDTVDGAIVREELGIPQDAFHIVTAAELVKNKNQRVVIDAIRRLNNPNIYYSICGKGPNEKALAFQIRKIGLKNRVFLRGYRNDIERVLRSADLFAFPSIREGLGVAAVEALLSRVPLIVSDNRGTREYARNGINAIVCRNNTSEEFADGIRRLYEDKSFLLSLAEKTVESAKSFTIAEVEKTMRGVYERSIR